ncbi:hypothetical protein [Pseudoalteromonas sp. T1lg48]|uniref:hypothetical protein n=1 Tax=Pseudoalteromonas sp. T1lg48 TaxID=2077100 RepID=UPI000CF5EE77|nr:hypothetical protein [Pseudoalteromonas sp. T1lg48]
MLSHLDTLKEKGPTLEYTKLVINIGIYEINKSICTDRISELYSYLSNISDKSIALTSLCILSLSIKKLNRIDIENEINSSKVELFDSLLSTDAFHVDIFREAIENESIYDITNAIKWSEKLNTQDRRSKAMSIILQTTISHDLELENHSFNDVVCLLRKVKNERFREDIYEPFVDYYFKKYESKGNYKKLNRVLNKIKSNYVKSKCLIRVLLNANNSEKNVVDISVVKEQLEKSISATDGFENKVELYFSAHKSLYNNDIKAAKGFKEKALQLKAENYVKVSDFAVYTKASIDLAIRCIYELNKLNLINNDDIEFLASKINLLGSEIEKSYCLARLVSCFQKNKNIDQADKIIEKYLLPLLDSFDEKDSKEFAMCCYHCLPVIYFFQYDSFENYLGGVYDLYNDISESILVRIVDYTLNDCLIYDPYNPLKKSNFPNLNYKSLKSICKVLDLSHNENSLIVISKKILDAVRFLKRKSKISKVQIDEILSQIRNNYDRFPFSDGISHLGYLVLLKAIVKNFDDKAEPSSWDDLTNGARAISNISDRAFLLCEIASLMPERSSHIKKSLFTESESSIKQLSSELEKLNRYSVLCENSFEFNQKTAQKFYKTALELCAKGSNSNSKEARLKFIDMVSRFDETFSSSLVTMFDDDPARVKSIDDAISRKKERQELENKFKKSADESEESLANENRKIARIAWDSLGNINAKSSHFNKAFDLNKVITNGQDYSIEYYYRVFSFYIHYLAEVYNGEDNLRQNIRPILDTLKSNILTISKLFALEEKAQLDTVEEKNDDYIVVSASNEGVNKAKEFLQDWFLSTKSNKVTIIDPYFDYESIEILAAMINRDPDIDVSIVTSIDSFKRLKSEGDEFLADTFKKYWSNNIASGELPSFSFQSLRYGPKHEFPIHDRFIYTENCMLSSGGSLNGYGRKVIQISKLSLNEMRATLEQVTPLINGEQKYFNQQKLYRSHDEV